MRRPPRSRPLRSLVLLLALVAGVLPAACSRSGSTASRAQPTPEPAYACQQPKPAGGVSLAGLAYGPYHAGQTPDLGVYPSTAEVDADIPTLACLTRSIRVYSSLGPAADLVQAAERARMSVNLGIWLGRDPAVNVAEIAAGLKLAASSAVSTLTVGNEVLLRGDLTLDQLRSAIQRVRAGARQLKHPVRVTTADVDGQWLAHRDLASDVDFVTVHLYPFWQHVGIDAAIGALDAAYRNVTRAFPGKQVVIGETGWPSDGPPQGAAVPSAANQSRYLRDFLAWTRRQKEQVQFFYFDAFDEAWKTGEAGVGAHWGLYREDGAVKPALADLAPAAAPATVRERSYRDVYVGGLEAGLGLGIDTSGHQGGWAAGTPAALRLAYPAGQLWGTMFITAGQAVPPGNRPFADLGRYRSLTVEMRALSGSPCVRIGVKDRSQPDDGSEVTVPECLGPTWSTVALPLDAFPNVDLGHVYVLFELVFKGRVAESVELRNLRYSPDSVPPLPTPGPVPMPFDVYTDAGAPGDHYVPSGAMGDYGDVTTDETSTDSPHSGDTCVRVVYSGARSSGKGWAGVYWQDPPNNWGTTPGLTGYDLSAASSLSFWVRGSRGGEKVKFEVGGIQGPYGDSVVPAVATPVMTLATSWQQVTIDLRGQDLRHVIGAFAWVVAGDDDPRGATFSLDDIQFR